jgi:hypothetical protein
VLPSDAPRFDPMPRAMPEVLPPEMIDLCVQVARDIDSELGEQLAALRERNPADFERRLLGSPRLYDLALVKKRDLNLYRLKLLEIKVDRDVSRLVKELRAARVAGRDDENILQQLRMQVRVQLALAHHNREEYLCRLQELVVRLERELEEEREQFKLRPDEIVDERIRELMDPADRPPPE